MTKNRSFAVTLLPLFATSAALHTALMLVAFRKTPIADHFGMGMWWVFLTVYRLVMTSFLKKPRELRSIVILSGMFVIGQLIVTLVYNPIYTSLTGWCSAAAMWIATYYQCANALFDGVKPENLMVYFEMTVLTLLFSAVVAGSGAMASGILIHLCISLFCILIAMMRQRTLHTRINTETRESTANLLLPLILLALAALVVVFCVIISGSAAQVLTQITAWLSQLLKSAVDLIGAFFYWLFSLFPKPDLSGDEDIFFGDPLPTLQQQEQPSTSNGIILYLLILAVVGGLVFCTLKIWRTVRLQGRPAKRRTVQTVVVKQSNLWESLARFFEKIRRKVRFEIEYLRRRNTAPGLLVWLERKMRRKRMKRKQGETSSAFLSRIGAAFPLCQAELRELSETLDRHYFGAGEDLSPEEVRKLRKKLKQGFSVSNNTNEKKSHS